MRIFVTVLFISTFITFVSAQDKSTITKDATCNHRLLNTKTDTIVKRKWTIYKTYNGKGTLIKVVKIKYFVNNESAKDFIRIIKEYNENGKLIHREKKKGRFRMNM